MCVSRKVEAPLGRRGSASACQLCIPRQNNNRAERSRTCVCNSNSSSSCGGCSRAARRHHERTAALRGTPLMSHKQICASSLPLSR
jgi:hypothetical protein